MDDDTTPIRRWMSTIDPHTGIVYYFDSLTRESQWERPEGEITPYESRKRTPCWTPSKTKLSWLRRLRCQSPEAQSKALKADSPRSVATLSPSPSSLLRSNRSTRVQHVIEESVAYEEWIPIVNDPRPAVQRFQAEVEEVHDLPRATTAQVQDCGSLQFCRRPENLQSLLTFGDEGAIHVDAMAARTQAGMVDDATLRTYGSLEEEGTTCTYGDGTVDTYFEEGTVCTYDDDDGTLQTYDVTLQAYEGDLTDRGRHSSDMSSLAQNHLAIAETVNNLSKAFDDISVALADMPRALTGVK